MIHFLRSFKYLLALVILCGTIVLQSTPASASIHMSRYMSSIPVATTPNAHGTDQVNAVTEIVQGGSKMYFGGYFSSASGPTGGDFSCGNLIVQDLRTKASSCPVHFNGRVDALVTSADGRYLYAGGEFTKVTVRGNAYARVGVVRIDTTSMSVLPFDVNLRGGGVSDLKIVGPTLIVAGDFTSIQGVVRPALASVSTSTALLNNLIPHSITGTLGEKAGATKVYRIAINPQNTRAVIIGNFTRVGGSIHLRAAMLQLRATSSSVSPWYAPGLSLACHPKVPAYIRDVDFSPDGKQFAMATTGGRNLYPGVCDSVSLWPAIESTAAKPIWVDYTPGDTMHSVVHTGPIIYASGHEKGHNTRLVVNGKLISPSVAPEVKVSGIAALSATSGKVVSRTTFWAGRDRGEGSRKLYIVPADAYHPAGMYVGSDTEWWYDRSGERAYKRERIAFLPMQ